MDGSNNQTHHNGSSSLGSSSGSNPPSSFPHPPSNGGVLHQASATSSGTTGRTSTGTDGTTTTANAFHHGSAAGGDGVAVNNGTHTPHGATASNAVHPNPAPAGYGHPQQQQQHSQSQHQQQQPQQQHVQYAPQQQQQPQSRSPVNFAGGQGPVYAQPQQQQQVSRPAQSQPGSSQQHHPPQLAHPYSQAPGQPQPQAASRSPQHPSSTAPSASAAPTNGSSVPRSWSVPNPLSAIPSPRVAAPAAAAPNPLANLTTNASSNQSRAALQQAIAAARQGGPTPQAQQQQQPPPQQQRPAVPHPLAQQQAEVRALQAQAQAQREAQQRQAQQQAAQQRAATQRAQQEEAARRKAQKEEAKRRVEQHAQMQREAQQQIAAAQHQAQQQQQQSQQQQRYAQQQQQQQHRAPQPILQHHNHQAGPPQQVGQQQQQQQQRQPQYAVQHQHHGQPQQQQQRPQQGQQQPIQQQQRKAKVVLSADAKQALAKAIWSAIKRPDGLPDPKLLEAAEATGLPRHAILNAAKVAKQRELEKKKEKAQQQQQQQPGHPQPVQQQPGLPQQHHSQQQRVVQQHATNHGQPRPQAHAQPHPPPPQVYHHPAPLPPHAPPQAHPAYHHPHQQQQQQQQHRPQHPQYAGQPHPHAAPPVAHRSHYQQPPQQQQQVVAQQKQQHQQRPVPSQPPMTASRPPVKTNSTPSRSAPAPAPAPPPPENPWRRVQAGSFFMQKGRFMVINNTLGAYTSRTSANKTLVAIKKPPPKKVCLVSKSTLQAAQALQEQLRSKEKRVEKLLDASKFRRIKVEPKKYAKALDRAARKARQTAADSMLKQQKEWTKTLLSHQSDFFKYHKNRKTEALKVAKACRDTLDKEEKQKEKESVQAERARLAALKSNDMTAYSKLLEETKNDRLKFLMDKTEESFTQISSLLHDRGGGNGTKSSGSGKSKEESSYYEKAHFQAEEVRQPSILVGGDLKEYQLAGLQWLVSLYNNKLNGILADEMGLGKTIQAIALIGYLMEFKHNLGPYLVIVPLSTLSNWQNEFVKWCPSARLVCYKGTPAVRKDIYKDQVSKGHFNVLLTTYEYIIKDKKYLRKIDWTYAIVDEGHRMKNAQSKFAVTLGTHYNTEYRVLLTGTPLMNQLSELWSLLNFLLPSVFNSVETFDQWFSRPFSQFGSSGAANNEKESETELLSNEERMLIIHRLHELLRPFMLRRVKSEVLDQLPEKVEKVLRCELSSWQKELYKQISRKAVESNNLLSDSFVQQGAPPSRGLNNVVMQLRKVCNHPMLFSPEGYQINDTIVRCSAKVALLDQMLPKLKAAGHRVLIFTQMTQVMTILEDYFSLRGYLSLRLDGSTPADEREKRMYKFNAPDSPYFIFLLSTRAGGLGLNLTAADTVVIFDSDWNPMMDLQAQDRAHRIGQRSDVSVFRLCTNSPVEEKILARATEKLNTAALVVEAGKFNKGSVESDNSLERKQLMEILLTDFDTSNAQQSTPKGPSEKTSDDGDEDDDASASSEKSKEEDINELLSNNDKDYEQYAEYDARRIRNGLPLAEVYEDPNDVPDWIKYPGGKEKMEQGLQDEMGDGNRKRKAVVYDDGLTEKQFLRLMDKQVIEEEKQTSARKKARKGPKNSAAKEEEPEEEEDGDDDGPVDISSGTVLTDWTFRKLINCTKQVVALKEPGTKRRLADLFLEKPAPQQFPDYYELIDKPIAINDILRKCRGKLYTHFSEYRDDWKLMIANAVKFNGEGSWVVKDIMALEKELDRVLKRNGFNEDSLPSPSKRKVPKKKQLRIKLSLKASAKSSASEGDENENDNEEPPPEPEPTPKKRRGRKKKA